MEGAARDNLAGCSDGRSQPCWLPVRNASKKVTLTAYIGFDLDVAYVDETLAPHSS
jgi:hypothetical protein